MYAFEQEKKALLRYISKDLLELFRVSNAIIAGGAITSIFSDKEINDLDVYFRNFEDMEVFIRNAYREVDSLPLGKDAELDDYQLMCVNHTDRSLLMCSGDVKVQLIHFKFFEDPYEYISDIFDSFDFTINMGAYDFSTDEFVFADSFLKDVAKRRLVFNPKTTYPIISTLRVNKYVQRGYSLSKKVLFQLGLAVNKLEITSWEELEDQLSGFYGVDVSELFDVTQEFSLDTAIAMLDLVEEDINHNVPLTNPDFRAVMTRLRTQHKIEMPNKFYKKVNYKDGKIHSVVQTHFEWKLDQEIDGGEMGVYVFETFEEAKNYSYKGNAVIEVVPANDTCVIAHAHNNEITITGPVLVASMTMIDSNTKSQKSKGVPCAPAPCAPPSMFGNI